MITACIWAMAVCVYGIYCLRIADVGRMTQYQVAAVIAGLIGIPVAAVLATIVVNG